MPDILPDAHPDTHPDWGLIGRPGSRAALTTPALIVDLQAMEHNIHAMAAYCRDAGISLRPHAKTHKSVRIARLQIEAGAVGICVTTLGEAEILTAGGIANLLITSPVVAAAKIDRLVALNAAADGLMVVTDSAAGADALAQAAGAAGKPLTVLVDFDISRHRTGVPDADTGLALARRIGESNALDFGGVQAYAGHLQHIEDYAERHDQAVEQAARVAGLKEKLEAAGLSPPVISGAGTGTHGIDSALGAFTEMQAGSYIFTDVQYDAVALRADAAHPFEGALFVQTTVISTNAQGFVTTDAGLKRFATDGPLPTLTAGAPADATYRFMGDEHGAVVFADPGHRLAAGSVVECLTPHCDPTVNLYDVYHIVRGDTLVDIWPVDARGAV